MKDLNKKALFIICAFLLIAIPFFNFSKAESATINRDDYYFNRIERNPVNISYAIAAQQLGYSNISQIPEPVMAQLVHMHDNVTRNNDSSYVISLSSTEVANLNAVENETNGSPSNITPSPQPSSVYAPIRSENTTISSDDSGPINITPDTPLGPSGYKACLIVAVWDYPGTGAPDVPELEDAYDTINAATTTYDDKVTLTNDQATFTNVVSYLESLCQSYADVDVFLMGHGAPLIGGGHCYVCYDAWDDLWGTLPWNGFYSSDFQSYMPANKDHSALRMGVACCCYGRYLSDGFLNPGGTISHDRAFCGSYDELSVNYPNPFLGGFAGSWFGGQTSYSAYENGYDNAYESRGDAGTMDYEDTGTSIYYDYVVSSAYGGRLSGNGNAWDASNIVGQNDGNYAHIYGGNYGDAGYVRGTMNHESSGEIVAYGYGQSGYYYSHLYCYVSDDGSNWYEAPNSPIEVNYWDGGGQAHYIDFGDSPITFRYISFAGYDDNGYSVSIFLDAVHVVK